MHKPSLNLLSTARWHIRALLAFSALLLAAAPTRADDWPQWRGPNRDGRSNETGLLKEWPKDGPKLLWQVNDLGGGYSTPSVADGRIYLMASKGVQDEFVKALSVKDGSLLWSTRVGKVGNANQQPHYPAARSTPTVDGKLVYVLGSDGDLASLDAASGAVRWRKSLRADFGGQPGTWAYAESPLVDGDLLVCTPGGAQATLLALNKNTAEVVWKCAVPGGARAGYGSISVTQAGGARQYVAYTGDGLFGVDAKTGKLLWRYDKTAGRQGMSILTPITGEGLVYSGNEPLGAAAVRLPADAGAGKVKEVYRGMKLPRMIGGAVLVGESLYGTSGPTLVCADFKTGQIKWSQRSVAPGAVCYADGLLYLHGENGDVGLVEATPEAYRERGRITPPNPPADRANRGEKSWAYPLIANGRLYIRDADCLWCYDIKAVPGRR
jgi:outer membrane protein assembly factor BamB